jgi:hypothetical protein
MKREHYARDTRVIEYPDSYVRPTKKLGWTISHRPFYAPGEGWSCGVEWDDGELAMVNLNEIEAITLTEELSKQEKGRFAA